MDFERVCKAADDAAIDSEAAAAPRVLVVYLPESGGMIVHRTTCGTHQIGGAAPEGEEDDFALSIGDAVRGLWPELPEQKQRKLQIVADGAMRLGLGKMLAGVFPDDEGEE